MAVTWNRRWKQFFGYRMFIGSENTERETNDCKSLYVVNSKNIITRNVCGDYFEPMQNVTDKSKMLILPALLAGWWCYLVRVEQFSDNNVSKI